MTFDHLRGSGRGLKSLPILGPFFVIVFILMRVIKVHVPKILEGESEDWQIVLPAIASLEA